VQGALERLRALRATLRECLASLDASAPDEPELGRVFATLDEGFQALGALDTLGRESDPRQRECIAEELEEVARLHAVLTSAVARDKERSLYLLERARTARRVASGAAGEARTGRSCDRSA